MNEGIQGFRFSFLVSSIKTNNQNHIWTGRKRDLETEKQTRRGDKGDKEGMRTEVGGVQVLQCPGESVTQLSV